MPYILKEDREELDSLIAHLVFAMKDEIKSDRDSVDLLVLDFKTRDLASKIKSLYGYYGAFAGLLNYSLHKIFLGTFPAMRYWAMALSTGWLNRVANIFAKEPISEIEKSYYTLVRTPFSRGLPPFGSEECLFKHITEIVCVLLACRVAPDNSQDSSDFIAGVFRHIDIEFYRRAGAVYEDKQIKKNGDLPEYRDLLAKIADK